MTAVNFKQIIQEMLLPELHDIKLDVATIKVEIKRIDEKIDTRFASVESRFNALDSRFTTIESRFHHVEHGLTTAIDIHERLAALEAKINR